MSRHPIYPLNNLSVFPFGPPPKELGVVPLSDQTQLDLQPPTGVSGEPPVPSGAFKADGKTFDSLLDSGRLGREMRACVAVMWQGGWFTLRELLASCREWASDPLAFSEAGISARLRDLRKARYGRQTIERRRKGSGWEYRWLRKSP